MAYNLFFINKLGLSFCGWVCYNAMSDVMQFTHLIKYAYRYPARWQWYFGGSYLWIMKTGKKGE